MRGVVLRALMTMAVPVLLYVAPSAASATACAGADPCPWTTTNSFGVLGATALGTPTAVAVDGSGHAWIADGSHNRVVELNVSDGSLVRLVGRNGGDGSAGTLGGEFNYPTGVGLDGLGHLWVTDFYNARVQELNTSDGSFVETVGWGVTDGASHFETCAVAATCQAGIGGGGSGQFNGPRTAAIDAGNNVYIADQYNARIDELNSSGAFVRTFGIGVTDGNFAFEVCTSATCRGGYYTSANGGFWYPLAVAVNGTGIYVVDQRNQRLQEFNPTTAAFVGKVGAYGFGNGQFYYPTSIALDGSGNVYATDNTSRVQEFSSSLAYTTTFAPGCCFADGQLDGGNALAFDSGGNLYVGDFFSRVQEFDSTASHNFVRKFSDSHFAPASGIGLNGPVGMAYDNAGDLFVADTSNGRVLKVNPTGTTVLARAGANGGDGGYGVAAGEFWVPAGLALDPTGTYVYVTDQNNNTVQKFLASNLSYVSTVVNNGCCNGPGQLYGARDIAVDSAGNIYVDEYYGNRIDEFDPSGAFIRRWGRQFGDGSAGSGPGQFTNPLGVGFDAQGNLVVTDYYNRAQVFTPTGTYVRTFGGPGTLPGEFNSPRTPRLDAGGETLVTDESNDRIQAFAPDGTFLMSWGSLGTGTGQLSDNNGLAVGGQKIAVTNWDKDTITTFGFSAVSAANAPVTAITPTTATLNATVNPGGGAAAYRWLYGPTGAYGSQSAVQIIGGTGSQPVSTMIAGLDPGMLYHAELIASSPGGAQTTADFTFTTATGAAGATGATGGSGSAGGSGPGGGAGTAGAAGHPGPPGVAGPNGKNGTVSCKFVQPKKAKHARPMRYKFNCTTTPSTVRASARLLRGRRLVATGTLRRGVIRLSASSRIRPGRYTVELLSGRAAPAWYTLTLT